MMATMTPDTLPRRRILRGIARSLMVPGLVLGLAAAASAAGPDYGGALVRQMVAQGYEAPQVRRTLLGKLVVTASRGRETREIVIDPRNGTILRDLTRLAEGGTRPAPMVRDRDGGKSGKDADDDRDDDDNSGSGGGDGDGGDDGDDDDGGDDDHSGSGGGDDGDDDDD